jgi:hypothetical protein
MATNAAVKYERFTRFSIKLISFWPLASENMIILFLIIF